MRYNTSMDTPYLSIIIPALDEEKYLPHLLTDLTKQTNHDFEVIVVDGGSKDKTAAKAKAFSNKLNLSIIHAKIRNVCHQRNLGAKHAKSQWLLFMDADNRIPPYFMQGIRYQIDKINPSFFIAHIAPEGNHPLDKALAQVLNTFVNTAYTNMKKPYLLESMLGIKKSIFDRIKGFDESISWSEGGELLQRLKAKKYKLTIFKEPKYIYSLRRAKKDGLLKSLRNSAYLILAHQTGVKIDKKTFEKYYPMLGGSFFNHSTHPHTTLEQIFEHLIEKYQISKHIESPRKYFSNLQKIFKDQTNK